MLKTFTGILLVAVILGILFYRYSDSPKGILPLMRPTPANEKSLPEEKPVPLNIAEGFAISLFAESLSGARVMVKDNQGNFWVSRTKEGKVSLIEVKDKKAINVKTVFQNLNRPHGLAFDPENPDILYIAEEDKISKVKVYTENPLFKKIADLPKGAGHNTRTIAFGPDGRLYVSIGSSCNVCFEEDERRAAIYSMNKDGSDFKKFAGGLRNAVFFTFHPRTKKMWATEMGRDYLGDDLPPDEINIVEEGKNYGWPICYGKNIHDADFDKRIYIRAPCIEPFEIPSYIDIPAHSAPLGLAFVPKEGWPEEYGDDLLVAYHGSWNRTVPAGYKIVRIPLDENGNLEGEIEDFITGWLSEKGAWGRPVDILIDNDGTMFITDDRAGAVYKVIYKSKISNLNSESIIIESPKNNEEISSPLAIKGRAKGFWFFEGVFPVKIYDSDGNELGFGNAQAKENWMSEDFVTFQAEIKFKNPATEKGFLVFENANPSGLPEKSTKIEIPVKFKDEKTDGCIISGCSGQICAEEEVITTCEYKPEYACYKNAKCERQKDGKCGWTMSEELKKCLENYRGNMPFLLPQNSQ